MGDESRQDMSEAADLGEVTTVVCRGITSMARAVAMDAVSPLSVAA